MKLSMCMPGRDGLVQMLHNSHGCGRDAKMVITMDFLCEISLQCQLTACPCLADLLWGLLARGPHPF